MIEKSYRMKARTFADAFALQPERYAWLLGAGASASSGIPTGYDMIADFKARIFCRENKLSPKQIDATDPLWAQRIARFFATQNILPPPGDPSEYARAFEVYLPSEADRRRYIDDKVSLGRPSFAHKVLGALLISGKTPCVFTTNFDSVIETAATLARHHGDANNGKDLTVSAIDDRDRALRVVEEGAWPLLVKLHGDFRSVELKNTEAELARQDAALRNVLVDCAQRFGLIVMGYSGRDASVMAALEAVLDQAHPYPAGIYWCTPSPSELLPAVSAFLKRAAGAGVTVHVVETASFDEFAGDLNDVVTFSDTLADFVGSPTSASAPHALPMPRSEARETPVLRCTALPLGVLPAEARCFRLAAEISLTDVRKALRAARARVIVARTGRDYAAIGSDADLLAALAAYGPELVGTVPLNPEADSWARGLIYDALIYALCNGRPLMRRLHRNGHSILVHGGRLEDSAEVVARRKQALAPLSEAYGSAVSGRDPGLKWDFAEGIEVRLDRADGRWWCVFDPMTHLEVPVYEVPRRDGNGTHRVMAPADREKAANWRRERWVRRYNKQWGPMLDAWSSLLAGPTGRCQPFHLSDGDGINPTLDIGFKTAWSRPSHTHPSFR